MDDLNHMDLTAAIDATEVNFSDLSHELNGALKDDLSAVVSFRPSAPSHQRTNEIWRG